MRTFTSRIRLPAGIAALQLLLTCGTTNAQVSQARADEIFSEARRMCDVEGGRTWGVSLCGPIVIVDASTKTEASSEPIPTSPRPPSLGFANAALDWGGRRWTTIAWSTIPDTPARRARLVMHELFHRVQPQLGLFVNEMPNDHLDTTMGRYWLQLEWRALAAALRAKGESRQRAIGDALAFRSQRRAAFPGFGEAERRLEINEGLAQYTATVTSTTSREMAVVDAISQLESAPLSSSFVRTFAYPSVAAYGLLLDDVNPGWPRRIKSTDDVGLMLSSAIHVSRSDAIAGASRYGGADLLRAEERREIARATRVAVLRERFVEQPVLTIPAARGAAFVTADATPISGIGTVYSGYHVANADWGSLDATRILVSTDRRRLVVAAPWTVSGSIVRGFGFTMRLAGGCMLMPGDREADLIVAC